MENYSPNPTPDGIYVARMAKGSVSSWGKIYVRYRKALIRFCGNFTRDPELAEEWTHDVLLKLKISANRFLENSELRPWLFRIARNVCLEHLRRRRDFDWVESVTARQALAGGDDRSQLSRLVALELSERALFVLQQLPEEERTVVILKFVEGMSREEIALVMETPIATVKSRLYRAMKLLAVVLS